MAAGGCLQRGFGPPVFWCLEGPNPTHPQAPAAAATPMRPAPVGPGHQVPLRLREVMARACARECSIYIYIYIYVYIYIETTYTNIHICFGLNTYNICQYLLTYCVYFEYRVLYLQIPHRSKPPPHPSSLNLKYIYIYI